MTEMKNRMVGDQAAYSNDVGDIDLCTNGHPNGSTQQGKSQSIDFDALIALVKRAEVTQQTQATAPQTIVSKTVATQTEEVKTVAAEGQTTNGETGEGDGMFFAPMSLDDLLALPPKEWVIDQVIGRGDIGMVYGAPGCGKTFVVIDMIFAACTGQQWAMRFDVNRPLNVAYAAGEGVSGLPARFAAASQHFGVSQLPTFTFFATVPQMFVSEDDDSPYAGKIYRFVNEWRIRQANGQAQPLDILIIDTLHSATAGADENSAQHMGIVLNCAKFAAKTLGCAVLLVHHTNKAGTGERGSSSIRGAMDVMIEIKRDSDESTRAMMTCAKLKDGEQWQSQALDLVEMGDSVRVWWYEPCDSDGTGKQDKDVGNIVAFLRDNQGHRYTAKVLGEAIGKSGSKQVFSVIKKAMNLDGRIKSALKNPDKDASPHNPMVYWYGSTEGGLENNVSPFLGR